MKSSSKNKILLLIAIILIGIISALIYRMNYKIVEVEYNDMQYHTWVHNPDQVLINKYSDFVNGKYGISEVFKDEEKYNEFINEYELEDLQLLHDFNNNNYVIVMFYVGYGSIKFDNSFNTKNKVLKFTLNQRRGDYYIADSGNYDSAYEIELPKSVDSVTIEYNIDNSIKYDDPPTYVDKQIIYIYPEKDMDITIKLGSDDLLTHTYPKYDNEWNVHVDTTGNIYDYKTNRNYYALYWEGIDNTKLDMSEGFVVKGEDTTKFLEEKLELLGLNEKEIDEFIMYWLPKLEDNKYNFIRFRTNDEINNYMPIEFSKEPDTLIRVMVDFKPLDKKIKVKEQKLEKTEREGFTIVEWGARLN